MAEVNDLVGSFVIEFVGNTTPRRINVARVIVNTAGQPLWLEDEFSNIYPWSTIIKMERR